MTQVQAPAGQGIAFRNRPNGSEIFANDRALLLKLKRQLATLTGSPEVGYVHPAMYPSKIGGQSVQFEFRLGLPYLLTSRHANWLKTQGALTLDETVVPAASPGQPPAPHRSGHRPLSQVAQTTAIAWEGVANKWLAKMRKQLKQNFEPLSVPHPELRHLIRQGLYWEAGNLIQEVLTYAPDELSQVVRYQIWLDYAQKNWTRVTETYEVSKEHLPTGRYLSMVAQAYLELDQPQEAAELLRPLLDRAYPAGLDVPLFLLGAKLHLAVGETDAAAAILLRLRTGLNPAELEKYAEELTTLTVAVQGSVAGLSPMPTVVASNPSGPSSDDLVAWRERLPIQPGQVYEEMQGYLDTLTTPAARLLLAQAAETSGHLTDAQPILDHLWAERVTLEEDVKAKVFIALLNAASRRDDMEQVVALHQTWNYLPHQVELLRRVAQAYEIQNDSDTAQHLYWRAYNHGDREAVTVRFLADWAFTQWSETSDNGYLSQADQFYNDLFSSDSDPDNQAEQRFSADFTPQDAGNWLMVLEGLNQPEKIQQVFDLLLRSLKLYEFPQWSEVLDERLRFVQRNARPPSELARAVADHFYATEPTVSLARFDLVKNALERSQDDLLTFLEEVESIDGLTQGVGTTADGIARKILNSPNKYDPDLLRRLKILVYSSLGDASYQALHDLEQEKRRTFQGAGFLREDEEKVNPLARKHICLVGGHERWQTLAEAELKKFYGVERVTRVPASWDQNTNEKEVSERTKGSDLILVMWRTLKHQTTNILHNLIQRDVLSRDQVKPVTGTGGKSFVREADRYFRASEEIG